MSRVDELRAELAAAELEAQYVAAKPAPERCEACGRRKSVEQSDEFRQLKVDLREARKALRELREGN